MGGNADLGMAKSYYVATANPFAPAPRLQGEARADVCVIGGGVTGLSAALHAAERGLSVVLLEAGKVGWGASGRNGGQMIPGLRKGAADLIASYGPERARALFDLALEARALTLDLIEKHRIACDLRLNGHLVAAAKPRDLGWMQAEVEALTRVMNYPHARVLDRAETQAELASPNVHGGLYDALGGHMHPLNFTLGLADAARAGGVRVCEHSRALKIQSGRVDTEQGHVKCRHVVLACDALLDGLEPRIAGRIMPVANYIAATKPLDDAAALIPHDWAVSDSRFVVNYFRRTADNRLLFGGGERYTPDPPADIAGFVRPYMERTFPQLRGVAIDYAWGGLVSITLTRLPHVGRMGEMFFAHGYSGQGVLISSLAGKLIAEAMAGTAERFDLFARIAPPEFPGGAALRSPLHVLGMLYYALRDRL
ncbi:MAG TPA: FAD-binding oxidoreductase [Caulobacterales bacterium]|nr:FAD-binding oxidoreductase [Caulobacterales bacterium]